MYYTPYIIIKVLYQNKGEEMNTTPRMHLLTSSNEILRRAEQQFPANEIPGSWILDCDVAVSLLLGGSMGYLAELSKVLELGGFRAAVGADSSSVSHLPLSGCVVLGQDVHDGC